MSIKKPLACIAVLSSLCSLSTLTSAQCLPHWEPLGIADNSGRVQAIIWHDDGSGPSLFVAGAFGSASDVPALNIARLSNGVGHALGEGLDGTINALATFDDGTGPKLYAGGSFTNSGSTQLLKLACWNGATWLPVGGGLNGTVYALAQHNDGSGNALFVGGNFTSAGGTPVSNIARWNGSAWNSLSGGVTCTTSTTAVRTLLSRSDLPTPVLYAAGRIVTAGGAPATPVVEWNGTSWANVSNEPTGNTTLSINSLAMYDPGTGTGPQLHRAAYTQVRRLENGAWTGTFLNVSAITSLCVLHDGTPRGTLYIGTESSSAVNGEFIYSGLLRNRGAVTEGTGLVLNGRCAALCEIPGAGQNSLGVGGVFSTANNVPAKHVATYSESAGFQSPGELKHGGAYTAVIPLPDSQTTYIGSTFGAFRIVDGSLVRLPASGSTTGFSGGINDLEMFSPNGVPTLVSAGYYMSPRFGSSVAWQNDLPFVLPLRYDNLLPQSNSSSDLCLSQAGGGTSLLMAGRFRLAGDNLYHGLLRYSTTGISSVATDPHTNFWVAQIAVRPSPEGEYIYALDYNAGSTPQPTLYVLPPGSTTWTPIPGTLTFDGVNAARFEMSIAWFDDDDGGHIYIGGHFNEVNGQPAHGIARLDGSTIVPLPAGIDGPLSTIHDLVVFDDGNGAAMYAAGRFDSIAGVPANNIAKFKNGQWSAVGNGVTSPTSDDIYTPPIYHLKPVSDSTGNWLYAVGSFVVADGRFSPKLARYGRCRPCPADFNNDGSADFFDYLDFVQAFSSNEPAADFNRDSVIDFFDYLDFVAAFSTGCP